MRARRSAKAPTDSESGDGPWKVFENEELVSPQGAGGIRRGSTRTGTREGPIAKNSNPVPYGAGPKDKSMKGLILAQSERWRRGLGMQVERESGGNPVSKAAKG